AHPVLGDELDRPQAPARDDQQEAEPCQPPHGLALRRFLICREAGVPVAGTTVLQILSAFPDGNASTFHRVAGRPAGRWAPATCWRRSTTCWASTRGSTSTPPAAPCPSSRSAGRSPSWCERHDGVVDGLGDDPAAPDEEGVGAVLDPGS